MLPLINAFKAEPIILQVNDWEIKAMRVLLGQEKPTYQVAFG